MEDVVKEIVMGCMESPEVDLEPDTDLWSAGITSMQIVRVMMAVEDEFEIELPEEALTREAFTTIRSIARAVSKEQLAAAASASENFA
ncbi:MAG TPA: phosphopantetheine-binding protein [Actinoplanes sp.]|nr:phosphopantetheine-binding protein [Actinoplanes sp.]